MATIYCLETQGLIWYVGSTTNAADRERRHKNKQDKGVGADLIPAEYEWDFVVLDTCAPEQRLALEREWIDALSPLLNVRIPGTGHGAEWRRNNPERNKEKGRKWREANADAHKGMTKAWREANKERHLENKREWEKANRDRINQQRRERYAAKKSLTNA